MLEKTGTLDALEAERTIEARGRIENLQELVGVAREYRQQTADASLAGFLQDIALVSDQDTIRDDRGLVTLMTLHNAKGLEFRAVFVIGMEEGIFPHARSVEEQGVEEERRLCYVGMTRAMEHLTLSHTLSRSIFGRRNYNLASRFLDELPSEVERSGFALVVERLRLSARCRDGAEAGHRPVHGRQRAPRIARRGHRDRDRAGRRRHDPLRRRRNGAAAHGGVRASREDRVSRAHRIRRMAYRVRQCRSSEELGQAWGAIGHYFGWVPQPEEVERYAKLPRRAHARRVRRRPHRRGSGGARFDLTVPGPVAIPCAGVTVVGTLPTHRRRGFLTRMMRASSTTSTAVESRSRLSTHPRRRSTVVMATGSPPCGREVRLPRTWAALRADAPSSSGAVRLVERDEAARAFPRVYERVRRSTPGFISRSRDWWELRRLWDDLARRPAGGGPLNYALLEVDGRPSAYALYRLVQREESGTWTRRLHVIEALGADVEGTREIWRFLFGIDWVDEILAWYLPADHPLMHLVARLDRLDLGVETGLWVRLVDVGSASLGTRVRDGRAGDVRGRRHVRSLECGHLDPRRRRRATFPAPARPAVGRLVARRTYLGGFSFAQLARAGLVEEARRGGLRVRTRCSRPTGHSQCPENF